MDKKFVKNLYTLINYTLIFFAINLFFFIFSFAIITLATIIIWITIDIILIIIPFLLRRIFFEYVRLTNEKISVYLYSKEIISYKWNEIRNVCIDYIRMSRGAALVIKFYVSDEMPLIVYHVTKKRIKLLKNFWNNNIDNLPKKFI